MSISGNFTQPRSDISTQNYFFYLVDVERNIKYPNRISDDSGMDFRAMLKKKNYGKWDDGEEEPDWSLKPVEKEQPQLKKVEKVSDESREVGWRAKGAPG